MGKLSPTYSCFKSSIVLHFLSAADDGQKVAATAACQQYFGLNQMNWKVVTVNLSSLLKNMYFLISFELHLLVNSLPEHLP